MKSWLLPFLCSTLAASAQPEIIRLRYQVCPPLPDGTYSSDSPSAYYEFNDDPASTEILSGTIAIGNTALLTIEWNTLAGKEYAVESTPELDNWRAPFARNSPWLMSTNGLPLSFQHSTREPQRFYRIIQKL